MPIQIERDRDDIVLVRAEGKLVRGDFPPFKAKFEQLAREKHRLGVLFDMTELDGWSLEGMWEEAKFDLQHNSDIHRLAVVGTETWQHLLSEVSRPFASAEIRYFRQDEGNQARSWLLAP